MQNTPILDSGFFLLGLGAILYIGVISSNLFEKYKIPDVMILILMGLILGPVLHLISPALLTPWMPIVGAIALSLILFEGGLDLDFDQILTRFGLSSVLAFGSFIATMGLITLVYRFSTGDTWMHSLLLGSTLGCVSSAVIIPVSNHLNIPQAVKTTINLESALSDMFGVVLTLVLIRIEPTSHFEPGHLVNSIIGSFTTAIIGGLVFGAVWLWALDRLRQSPFSYMMTLAAVFVLYGLTEMVHGSGPMAVLTFGAVLPNADNIAKLFGRKFEFVLDDKIKQFNTEGTFFARTFFFVYLGLVVSFRSFNWHFLLVLIGIFSAIIVCRYLVVKTAIRFYFVKEAPYESTYLAMIPRGLTSAVLVGMVQAQVPGTQQFLEYAFTIILLTNALMTLWVYRNEASQSEFGKEVSR